MKAKNLLALTLALTLALSLMSVSAFAETVNSFSGMPYSENTTVNLGSDTTTSLGAMIGDEAPEGTELTINLNNHKLTLQSYGSISSGKHKSSIIINGGGTLVLNTEYSGIETMGAVAVSINNTTIEGNKDINIQEGGQLNLNGVTCKVPIHLQGTDFHVTNSTFNSISFTSVSGEISSGSHDEVTICNGTFASTSTLTLKNNPTIGKIKMVKTSSTQAIGPYIAVDSSYTGTTKIATEGISDGTVISKNFPAAKLSQFSTVDSSKALSVDKDGNLIIGSANPEMSFTPAADAPVFILGTASANAVMGTVAVKNITPASYTCTVVESEDADSAEVTGTGITATVDTADGNKLKVNTTTDTPGGKYFLKITADDGKGKTITKYTAISVGTFLDREDDTTAIPDSYDIPQTYDLTVTELGNRDVTKVRVTWETEEITATSKRGKVWNPDTFKWVDDIENLENSASSVTAKFKLENLSSIKVRGEVAFTRGASFTGDEPTVTFTDDSETATDGKVLLGSVVNENDEVNTSNPHSANVTVALTPTASDFGTISAGKGVYGNYTVKLVAPTSRTITVAATNFTADSKNAASMDEFTSTTLKYTAAEGYIFSSGISYAGVEQDDISYEITDNGKTAIVTVNNPTDNVVLNLTAVKAAKISFQNNSTGTLSVGADYYVNVPKGSTVTFSSGGSTITATFKEGENTYTSISINSNSDNMVWSSATTNITAIDADTTFVIVNGE